MSSAQPGDLHDPHEGIRFFEKDGGIQPGLPGVMFPRGYESFRVEKLTERCYNRRGQVRRAPRTVPFVWLARWQTGRMPDRIRQGLEGSIISLFALRGGGRNEALSHPACDSNRERGTRC